MYMLSTYTTYYLYLHERQVHKRRPGPVAEWEYEKTPQDTTSVFHRKRTQVVLPQRTGSLADCEKMSVDWAWRSLRSLAPNQLVLTLEQLTPSLTPLIQVLSVIRNGRMRDTATDSSRMALWLTLSSDRLHQVSVLRVVGRRGLGHGRDRRFRMRQPSFGRLCSPTEGASHPLSLFEPPLSHPTHRTAR